ncbi:MAG: NAD(P)-dependent oxidoreductase [Pseudolysinimonas sp.]
MKILVTGSTGRIGTPLRRRLAEGPHEATYLARGGPAGPDDGTLRVDITDRMALIEVVAQAAPDVIVHLASLTGKHCDLDPESAERINVVGTSNVVEAAGVAGVRRIVFASTSAVYGDGYAGPADETQPVAPRTRYAHTKFEAEQVLADAMTRDASIETLSLRIFNVFGPAFDDSLVNRLLESSPDDPVVLLGLDQFVRDYSHVDSIVEGFHTALGAPLRGHSTINLGSGSPISNRRLLEVLAGRGALSYSVVDGARSYSCADIGVARAILGFTPQPV